MSISAPFIVRAIATSLMMLAILLTGILAYQILPVAALPEVEYPTMQVTTFYPGASPEVVASSITAPLERQFGQMTGLTEMSSTSSIGVSVITLQFNLNMHLDVAEQEVQAAINAASNFLPNGLPTPPVYSKVNPADIPIMTLALTSQQLSLPQVEDFAETRLAQKISQVLGVGIVRLSGGQRPAVRIQANPTALSAYGLSLETIRSAVETANVNAPKGNLDGPRLAYMINANDQLLSAKDYDPLIIAYRNNAAVHLSDVAKITEGAENNWLAAWKNTEPAIILTIQKQPGANVIEVVDRIHRLLPQLQTTLPSDIKLSVLTDRTITIRHSVRAVQFELLLSVVLVVLVIFLFLRNFSATIIPSISVPLSLIGSFGLMYLFNFSLNNLTLMALTIAAGFVVDDAIVMIENISRYLEQGETPFNAALKGAEQISFTILSLTLALIAVLIPLLFMEDIVGKLFREFALTLSITILISAFVSLTLTPMLCARMLHYHPFQAMNAFERKATVLFNRLIEKYKHSLTFVLNHQPLTLFIFLLTLTITLLLAYFIPKGFFPLQDTGMIQATSETSQSISFSAMKERQQTLIKTILDNPNVESLSSFIGIDGINTTLNSGRLLINLKPAAQRMDSTSQVIGQLQDHLQDKIAPLLFMQPVQDLTIDTQISRTQYQYSLSSPDEKEVAQWSDILLKKMSALKTIRDVASDQQNLGLQTYLHIDRNTASRLGITAQSIDEILYDAFGQRQIATLFTQRNQYHVILEALPQFQRAPAALNSIYITPPNQSAAVPLNVFAQVKQTTGPLVIHRQGQFPVATLSFNLASNVSLGQAIQSIIKLENQLAIPKSIQTSFKGSAKIFQHALANEGWLVIAAIIVVYIVLGVLYESYIHPITILSTLPSAAMGALLALWLTQKDLTVIALIGIILLIGIVMKNAILMIDFALEQERQLHKTAEEAIFAAALLRFRPILMTTMASLLGAFPLAFATGMGAELRQPLGIAIIGGLIVSQLLTLYSTPVIYITFDKMARHLFGKS